MSQFSLSLSPPPTTESEPTGLVTVVIPPLNGEYLYAYNREEIPALKVGDSLEVSLGRRATNAFVISVNSDKETEAFSEMKARSVKIKRISAAAVLAHAFTQEHLDFFRWIAKYYAEPLSKIIDLAVPTPTIGKPEYFYTIASPDRTTSQKRTELQARVLTYLLNAQAPVSASELKRVCDASSSVLSTLVKKGLIHRALTRPQDTNAVTAPSSAGIVPILNEEQRVALAAIQPNIATDSYGAFLLQGVTGSGKTEVYLELIHEVLQKGGSALVVVPEIALTPQLTDRFAARLRQPIAVLHSGLKPRERWQHWADLASGQLRVAIGARSAIFAPMQRLGIIVVDEEHDSSLKQGEGIRYHARDLALVRGKLSNCPVILGSATPSLETYHNALQGKYQHLHLTRRFFDGAASSFEIVDLSRAKLWEMPSKSVSPRLLEGLNETLARGGQAFILFNKRGFASYLQCSSCEQVLGCPHCSVTLTYHRNSNSLLCHQCNFSTTPPVVCLGCGARESLDSAADPLFAHRGSGTERVHEELSSLIPTARIAKLDRDSAATITDYVEILNKVRAHEVDILVGTQMIAKGHDLPNVTFVGIIDCDVGLHVPDFRASERVFHLLTQVAGRAGRRKTQGRVVLQTRAPTHPSLTMTVASNYGAFAKHELQIREELGYPPFQRLLRIIVSAEDRAEAMSKAGLIAQWATPLAAAHTIPILGPAPAPIEKIRKLWRYHILLKSPSTSLLQHIMQKLKRSSGSIKNIRIAFDLDPHDML